MGVIANPTRPTVDVVRHAGEVPKRCLYFGMLDLQRLLTFEAVVRLGTFAAAAREVGFTQPGVSQQMRGLERDLDAVLFVREGRGLGLSEQGRALASQLPALLREIRATRQQVASVGRLQAGRVRMCAFPSANAVLVPAAMARLRAGGAPIEIELFEAEPDESLAGLLRGEYDVVVSFHYGEGGRAAAGPDGVQSFRLLEEPLVLLLPETHPLAARETVELGDLADERWIAGCERCRRAFVDACHDAGFAPRIEITSDDALAVQSLVVAGLGLAVVPCMAQSFVTHPRLRARAVLPLRTRTVTAASLLSTSRSPAVDRVLTALRDVADRSLATADS